MKEKFITNLAFLILVNFLVKPAALLVEAAVQNEVGTQVYGSYTAIFNFSTLFYILLDFGITSYNNRNIASNPESLNESLPRLLQIKGLLAIAYLVITFGIAFILGYSPTQYYLLAFMAGSQIMLSMLLYLRSNVSGLHFFRVDSLLSVLDKLLLLILVSCLLWAGWGTFKIQYYAYAQLASLALAAIAALFFLVRKTQGLKFTLAWTEVTTMLRATYPYALLGVLMTLYYRIDTVMIERMLPIEGDYEAGAYMASFRFLDAANNVALLFAALLLPMFARILAAGEAVQELLQFSFKLLFTGAIIVMSVAFFFRYEIVNAIYHESTPYWGELFGLLFLAFGAVCSVYIYGTLLTASGNVRVLNLISFGGVLLNIVLNLILIPRMHAVGSALATLVTQWAVALMHIVAANKAFQLTTNLVLIGKLAFFLLLVVSLGLLIDYSPLSWTINLCGYSIILMVFAFAIRLFDRKEMVGLLKSQKTV
ncbi:MAG: oligosaccharide flippase family protein [Chitinophagales bacterium]|nr:oligosaccharide flippase family protein [Chitinophagales bacterium]